MQSPMCELTTEQAAGDTARISFNLIENALDYLLSAAERVQETEPRDLKYALRDLSTSIELLFKARL
jgi:hypothetical protein